MKKLIIVFTAILSLLWQGASSQNLIAVQNGGTPAFYTVLDSAIFNAQNGDTIYIPGGNFSINDTINKRIHLVGSGHHSDSANVTARTLINGNSQIILDVGADYGSLIGIYFLYPGYYAFDNIRIIGNVTGYSITRCYVTKGIQQEQGVTKDCLISENIITKLNLSGINNSVFNNLFLGYASIGSLNTTLTAVKNNVFTFTSPPGYISYALYGYYCLIENNIMASGLSAAAGDGNIYHNNINLGVNGINNANQGSGNFLDNVSLQSIFVNFNPSSFNGDEIYNNDFHLPPDSPYKNAGRDGTDIGIYGGVFPWKEGSIPFNPHFQALQIAPKTDSIGNLNVNIKVAAQDH